MAIFGHVFEPPAPVAAAFATAYRRVVPDSPFNRGSARRPLDMYQAMYARFADKIRDSNRFSEPEQWFFEWDRVYARDEC